LSDNFEQWLDMTIRIPEDDSLDKILHLFGKRRAVKIPEDTYQKFGPYVYARGMKENFWRALLRPKGKNPPKGYVYAEDFLEPINRLNIE
jgi:hypothetical protein